MDLPQIFYQIAPYLYITGFLFLSAFFSGSETAIFSLTAIENDELKKSSLFRAQTVVRLLGQPNNLLITIILANLFVNIGLTNYFDHFLSVHYKDTLDAGTRSLYTILILTPVLVLFSEILPKIVGVKLGVAFSQYAAPVIFTLSLLIWPVRKLVEFAVRLILKPIGFRELGATPHISRDELDQAVSSATSTGIVSEKEGEHLRRIIEANEIAVREVMTPFAELFLLPDSTRIASAKRTLKKNQQSLVFLQDESQENITGVVKLSHLMPYFFKLKKANDLSDVAERVPSFLESITLNKALENFLTQKDEIALVVDEFGKVIGALTLKIVLDRFFAVAEGSDRTQPDWLTEHKKLERSFIVQGATSLDNFNYVFGAGFESQYVETLGGFLVEKLGSFPDGEVSIAIGDDFIFSDIEMAEYKVKTAVLTLSNQRYNNYLRIQAKRGI